MFAEIHLFNKIHCASRKWSLIHIYTHKNRTSTDTGTRCTFRLAQVKSVEHDWTIRPLFFGSKTKISYQHNKSLIWFPSKKGLSFQAVDQKILRDLNCENGSPMHRLREQNQLLLVILRDPQARGGWKSAKHLLSVVYNLALVVHIAQL